MPQSTQTYEVKFPYNLCGATMRIVLPGRPELSMLCEYIHPIAGDDYFPCSFGLSFPCDHEYDFEMGLDRFNQCSCNDNQHGHILLSSDDGTIRLPHLIYSQADVLQVLADIKRHCLFDVYLGDTEKWMSVLKYIYTNDPVIQRLPKITEHQPKSFDLQKVGWWS